MAHHGARHMVRRTNDKRTQLVADIVKNSTIADTMARLSWPQKDTHASRLQRTSRAARVCHQGPSIPQTPSDACTSPALHHCSHACRQGLHNGTAGAAGLRLHAAPDAVGLPAHIPLHSAGCSLGSHLHRWVSCWESAVEVLNMAPEAAGEGDRAQQAWGMPGAAAIQAAAACGSAAAARRAAQVWRAPAAACRVHVCSCFALQGHEPCFLHHMQAASSAHVGSASACNSVSPPCPHCCRTS